MAFSTHLGPARFGTVKEGSAMNCGLPVLTQSNTVAFTDTSAKTLFVLPAGSQVLSVVLDVVTGFDDTGTDLLDVGISTDGDLFVNDADVSTAVHVVATLVAANLATITNIGTSDVTVTATYTGENANAAAGLARVSILYVMKNSDGSVTPIP